ncbi:adhesion protein FadA [Fusobacterium periodonticum]|uniref:adhesion protein FadA n=1 Tax=Fusobacterium periodonticum TaxID=860 RepID=UPI0028D2A3EE|nr:adhesion protein FadA [Fusobacterium periodonticum]
MKKKIILAISVLMLSNLAMAAPAKSSVESSLSNLEAQLEKLTQLEEQKYKEQEALANAAAQRLENYRKMDEVVSQRISQIEENVNKVIFSKEFKNKASEYKALKLEISKEMEKENKTIEEFRLVQSLR